ncbi:protease [Penaeus vannamei]|uniref:Protease n=1 Tax=Penaeus vannamei TaxID=6689 RepID=A0A3R7PBS5_PENVA|nr:protease [Penaeus vannamei]
MSNEFSGGLLCEIYTVGGTTPCSITREYCDGCGVAPISVGSTKIVNGAVASVGEYPYQVGVLPTIAGLEYRCGGSIIKERWILTAAHCFYDNSKNKATSVDIIYGTIYINGIGGTRVTASRFIDHPGYDSSTYANDIALVELPQSLNYATDTKIQPICLGLEEDIPFGGKAVASGWGDLSFEGSSPDVLQEVELDIITINECQQKESLPPDTNSVVCALTLYKDTCQGDSGGPLVAKLCDGTWAQIGIVSYGFQCAVPGKPGVYTRVSAFASWISNNTGGSSCSSTLTLSAELDNRAKEREAVNEAKNEVVRIGQDLDGLETTLNATRGRRRRRRNLTLLQELTTALNKSADVLLSRNVQRINSLSSELAALRGRLVVFTAQVAAGASGLDVPALLAGVGSAKQTAQNATKVARQELAEIEVEIQIIVAKFENSGSTVPPLPSLEPEPTVKPVTPTTSPTTPPPTTPNVPTTIAPSTTASPPTPTTAPPSPGTSTCSITREYCNGCGVAPISVGSTKIVNGTVASVGEYPYQVGVLPTIAGLEYRCGGSIIKERWILTAAHCFYDKSSNKATSVDIIYGTIYINGIGGTRVTASRFIDHPGYNSSTKANDIALVELPQPLNYTIDAKIQPICLGLQEDIPFGGKAVASGWGDLSFDGLSPNVLQEVELDIITIDECQQKESLPPDTNSVVCALTLYKDTCQGDSGGPLVAKLCDGTWAQIGIVSYGFQCAVPDKPGVYTRVSAFASWISNNTGGSSCSSTLTTLQTAPLNTAKNTAYLPVTRPPPHTLAFLILHPQGIFHYFYSWDEKEALSETSFSAGRITSPTNANPRPKLQRIATRNSSPTPIFLTRSPAS